MNAAVCVIAILVLGACFLRFRSGLRACGRVRSVHKTMARTLQTSVRRENIRQSIAALRVKREIVVEPAEVRAAALADLRTRIERIQLRGVRERNRRSAGFNWARSMRQSLHRCLQFPAALSYKTQGPAEPEFQGSR